MIRCLIVLLLATAARAEITRGPYVQMPDSNGVTIVWRTKDLAPSRIDFGLTADCQDGHVALTNSVREHVVVLTGLRNDTNYFYRVDNSTRSLRTRRTAGHAFRFAVIGDFGEANASAAAIAHGVNQADIDLLLTVGDNVYPGGERKFYDPRWFTPYAPTMRRVPCFPVLGNHDLLTDNGQPFLDNFFLPRNGPPGLEERNYSFDYGDAHFVAIDSNPFAASHAAVMSAITKWVARDLAASKQPWKIAYFHHPAYTSPSDHDETPAVRDRLMPVLEAGGVQMVFAGHNHFYERIQPVHGLVEIITGGGGQSLYKITSPRDYSAARLTERHSFTVVEIAGAQLTLQQIDEDAAVVDTYQLTLPKR